ncbi:unnamed protein product [Parnassius mnemosyne]|uniref:PiggyBac transposable element-derived protein domain-containing protein n=1 Tax=Parnassius mnemosyne TaxID=213953 RepID=A0AAV1LC84_9NEOP
MIDAMPYLGKCTQTNGLPLGEFYVKELTKAVHGSNRNVTCDNWFTSVPLAKNLLRQPYNLTLVGTIRSNKREIPEELKRMHFRRVRTSMFCYDGPLTLVSYKPKPSKLVFVLSSCDEEGTVHTTTGKPNMIHFYNSKRSLKLIELSLQGVSPNQLGVIHKLENSERPLRKIVILENRIIKKAEKKVDIIPTDLSDIIGASTSHEPFNIMTIQYNVNFEYISDNTLELKNNEEKEDVIDTNV